MRGNSPRHDLQKNWFTMREVYAIGWVVKGWRENDVVLIGIIEVLKFELLTQKSMKSVKIDLAM